MSIEERIPNQIGETYLMPRRISYCRIDCSSVKTKKAVKKWLDEHDEYRKHKIIKLENDDYYITNFGTVREGDWLYYPKYAGGYGIGLSSWKEFPRQTLDTLDTAVKGYFYKDHLYDAAKRIKARIEKDRKEMKEIYKRNHQKPDFS